LPQTKKGAIVAENFSFRELNKTSALVVHVTVNRSLASCPVEEAMEELIKAAQWLHHQDHSQFPRFLPYKSIISAREVASAWPGEEACPAHMCWGVLAA